MNLAHIIEEAGADIVEIGISAKTIHDALEELVAWREQPDAALWHAVSWAEGVRPPVARPQSRGARRQNRSSSAADRRPVFSISVLRYIVASVIGGLLEPVCIHKPTLIGKPSTTTSKPLARYSAMGRAHERPLPPSYTTTGDTN